MKRSATAWRRSLRASACVAVALAGGAATASAEPPDARRGELLNLLRQDCGACHGLTMRGGLGPALLPRHLAGRTDSALAQVILDGVPGTPMPPWRPHLDEDEALWLVRQLKRGL